MLRPALAIAALCALPFAGFAQDADPAAICADADAEPAARDQACTQLIDAGGQPDADMAALYVHRADARAGMENAEGALVDLAQAIALAPDDPDAYGDRAWILAKLERFDEALADTSALIRVEPDDSWNHYYHGYVLRELGQLNPALVALKKSHELDPEYFWALFEMGRVYRDKKLWALAQQSFDLALMQARFDEPKWSLVGRAWRDAGQEHWQTGAHYYRVGGYIDPNSRASGLAEYLWPLPDTPVELPPMEYQPPRTDAPIRYIQTLLPRETRSEMELAIMEIANWFSPEPKAMPKLLSYFTRTVTGHDGDVVASHIDLDRILRVDDSIPRPPVWEFDQLSYRDLMRRRFAPIGPGGFVVQVDYDPAAPVSDLWPLEVGRSVTGTGSFQIVCPEKLVMMTSLLGCREGMDFAQFGTLEYGFEVLRTERVHVPLGQFETYVLRYRELGVMTAGGVDRNHEFEITWWVAPALGTWVQQMKIEGEFMSIQYAMGTGPWPGESGE